jgi:hypothetical protein
VTYQSDVDDDNSQGGLGDLLQSLFFSPERAGRRSHPGCRTSVAVATATDDRLGSEQWADGPTAVMLSQSRGWRYGVLANHLWDYAGNDERADVNSTFLQPFVSFTTKGRRRSR